MKQLTQLSPPKNLSQFNFDKPRFDDHEAAAFIGCSAYTLKRSRTTGTLLGVASPKYSKMGRMVRYERVTLEEWLGQFPEYQNTCSWRNTILSIKIK